MKNNPKLPEGFCWSDIPGQKGGNLTDAEKYKRIVHWAAHARGQNPGAFDALTQWVLDAVHKREGYNSGARYDVTRNIMLGQGVPIPNPDQYWTGEVFPDGCGKDSTAYLFSAEL